jgi:hypothetical protein
MTEETGTSISRADDIKAIKEMMPWIRAVVKVVEEREKRKETQT